ncbi:hypothetical protein [Yinghuangia seranimata]|uniref:hypothetical protein n=1 Tax=Yinghuangia seranimata TaxID=408067 RepID=UPI00248CB71A|nr:hypothetical protein [Yinghuangia seranimata]MDI2126552.1 hypothetical protein [Yinghuangia seranimata]
MSTPAARRIPRIVGASCLAAAVAFPTAALAAPAAVAQAPSAASDDTPPPSNQPTPGPTGGAGTQPTPNPSKTGTQKTESPKTGGTGGSNTPSSGAPGTTSTGTATTPGGPVQGLVQQDATSASEKIATLNLPDADKQRLQDGVAKALAAVKDPNTPKFEQETYAGYLANVNLTLKTIQAANTQPEDRAFYTRVLQGSAIALAMANDPNTSPDAKTEYLVLARDLSGTQRRLVNAYSPTTAAQIRSAADATVTGLQALQDQKTAPKTPEDQQKVQQALREIANMTTAAVVVLQDPNATPQAKAAAQQTLDARANVQQNPDYVRFLIELKRFDPPAACLDVVQNRTTQAGWPDGSLWGLSDDACAGTLAKAALDTSSPWNPLFNCVKNQAFSTCEAYIPNSG